MSRSPRLLLAACCIAGPLAAQVPATPAAAAAPITAIRVGRLIDPESGTAASNQVLESICIHAAKLSSTGFRSDSNADCSIDCRIKL